MTYTVILMYPECMQDSGHDTFMTAVNAGSPKDAVEKARVEMRESNCWPPGRYVLPVIAVFRGDHEDIKDGDASDE